MEVVEGSESVVEIDKLLFENIQKENVSEIRRLLSKRGVFEEVSDENGMSLLQHAAYKGNKEICNLLLDWGANVNSKRHVHGYTALMFAGLSGKEEVVTLLLKAGAKASTTNSVGKTAAETAAFVGNHTCAVLINNYIPKADVEYYSRPQGLEQVAKLPSNLVTPLHNLLIRTNIHPISIVKFLQNNVILVQEAEKVYKVSELMCEKESKRSDVNELLAFKFYFNSFIVKSVHNMISSHKKQKNSDAADSMAAHLDRVIKCWMQENKSEFQAVLDKVIVGAIGEFPYRTIPLIQKMVHSLTNKKISAANRPTAISVLISAMNGSRMFSDSVCTTCGNQTQCKKCATCKTVEYCDQQCQRYHWSSSHKYKCKELASKQRDQRRDETNVGTDKSETVAGCATHNDSTR